jgi:hypothetical protein
MQTNLIKMKNTRNHSFDDKTESRDPKRDKNRKKDFSKNRQVKRNSEG